MIILDIINNLKNKVNCAIIDLETKEYIMVDEDSGNNNNLQMANVEDFKQIESMIQPPKVSVYDLILLHVESRGKLISTLDEKNDIIDTYFKFEDFSSSYEKIGKYMGI